MAIYLVAVPVRQDHIERAKELILAGGTRCGSCPIALAVKEAIDPRAEWGYSLGDIVEHSIDAQGQETYLSLAEIKVIGEDMFVAYNFVRDFDADKPVEPLVLLMQVKEF